MLRHMVPQARIVKKTNGIKIIERTKEIMRKRHNWDAEEASSNAVNDAMKALTLTPDEKT